MAATGGRGTSAGFGSASVFEYFLTQCGAVWMYLGRILWPRTLILDHGDGLATLATAWPWLLATLAALALIAVGFWRRPRLFFPAVAPVLLLAPSSSIVPIATQTIAEHRAYLASAAVIGLLLTGIVAVISWTADSRAREATRLRRIVTGAVVTLLIVACLARTVIRNRDFASAAALWTQNIRDCPRNPRGLKNLIAYYRHNQRYDIAAAVCREAIEIPELAPQAACSLGDTLVRLGHWQRASAAYAEACRMTGRVGVAQFTAHAGLASCQVRLGSPADALATLEAMKDPRWKTVLMMPGERHEAFGRGLVCRAAALRQLGPPTAADAAIAKAMAYAREHADAAYGIARACDDMGEFAAAAVIWEPLAEKDPSLLANLAASRIESGQFEGAIDAFRRAVAAYPDDPRMRENLARAEVIAAQRVPAAPKW
jgi:tetratricopeptide (TPR) repeat protein